MGIGIEQIFGKLGGFFSTNVNPLALKAIDWKFFAIYCGWIAFEFATVYLLYPETYNRTLEELAFCMFGPHETCSEEPMLTVSQCSKTTSSSTSKRPRQRRCSTRICRMSARRRAASLLSALFDWTLFSPAQRGKASCGSVLVVHATCGTSIVFLLIPRPTENLHL
jgi:hypothetical protein